MKIFLVIIVTFFVTDCSNRITDPDHSDNTITLKTDKHVYSLDDSITVKLSNHSDSTFVIGLVCGQLLDVFYQFNEDGTWSDYINLYMYGCPTFFDSLKSDEVLQQAIPATALHSSGTFRLLVNEKIISNSFVIN
jgi:hypothetical protein